MYISMKQCIEANNNKPFKGVIHIGAHHGEEAEDYANNEVKNVLWIEANQNEMKHLYDKTCNVPIKSKYFCATMSDVDGQETTLNIANNGQSSSLLEFGTHARMYPHIQYVKRMPVKTKRFDTLARENVADINLELYDFININIQGTELKALKGFGNLFDLYPFEAIYTEVNFEHVYKDCCLVEDLDSFLSNFGFQRVLTSSPGGTWGDSLYIRNI